MVEKLRRFAIDVALLPINGRGAERGVAGNLNAREAVWLARQAGVRTVIPCHYGMFAFNTADPAEFTSLAGEAGQHSRVVRCGQRWDSRSQLA
jgi:L-ascorbate metabolism protein UlaG (beta-lactamase superfamily)